MFKAIKPKPIEGDSFVIFPHCDPRILHAPGECKHCDELPEWQHLRVMWGIAFTGYTPEGTELPCPADYARGDTHKLWSGNQAKPERCSKAAKQTGGRFTCTRQSGHDGPCAAEAA
jgi:hypothetical protein